MLTIDYIHYYFSMIGFDVRNPAEKVAIKVEKRDTKYPQLLDEYNVYRNIKSCEGFPNVRVVRKSRMHVYVCSYVCEGSALAQ